MFCFNSKLTKKCKFLDKLNRQSKWKIHSQHSHSSRQLAWLCQISVAHTRNWQTALRCLAHINKLYGRLLSPFICSTVNNSIYCHLANDLSHGKNIGYIQSPTIVNSDLEFLTSDLKLHCPVVCTLRNISPPHSIFIQLLFWITEMAFCIWASCSLASSFINICYKTIPPNF